jgi:UDP-N-acetylmuramoylalanine--D-glutamate ligase
VVEHRLVIDATHLESWSSDWSEVRTLVLGLGAAGFAAADTLVELGSSVLIATEETTSDFERLARVIGAELHVGSLETVPDAVAAFAPDLVIVSPGFPVDAPVLAWARTAGIAVWGDVELAWRVRDKVRAANWLAVTGEGSALTTDLALHILLSAGKRAVIVGDDAPSILDAVRDPAGFDILLVELGARRLRHATASPVSPLASVCVAADADDDVLGRIYENTREACIYNKADIATMHMVEEADVVEGCRAIGFDLGSPGPSDLGIVDGIIVDRAFHDDRQRSALELTTHGELAAVGLSDRAGVTSVLAASALARAVGVPPREISAAIATFGARQG